MCAQYVKNDTDQIVNGLFKVMEKVLMVHVHLLWYFSKVQRELIYINILGVGLFRLTGSEEVSTF